MRYLNLIIFSLFIVLNGCDAVENDNNVIPSTIVESGKIATSYISHDTIKHGIMNFYAKTAGSVYSWNIFNSEGTSIITNDDKVNSREFTFDFSKHPEGIYTVSLDMGGGNIYKGTVNIKTSQDFSIDLDKTHTFISDKQAGSLYVYGLNDSGQLCTDTQKILSPALLQSYKNTTAVGTGLSHTLFVDNNNLYACGDNTKGQLGLPQDIDKVISSPKYLDIANEIENKVSTYIGIGDNTSIIGVNYTEGRSVKTKIYLAGFDGQNNNYTAKTIVEPTSGRNEPLISVGKGFYVLRATGSYNVYSMGINNKWQLGRIDGAGTGYANDSNIDSYNPDKNIDKNKVDITAGYVFTPYGEEKLKGDFSYRNYFQNNYFAKLASGDDFTLSIKKETTEDSNWTKENRYALYVWGSNDNGQLGFKNQDNNKFSRRGVALFNSYQTTPYETDPNKVTAIKAEIKEVAAGRATGYAIDSTGKLYGWGASDKGQLTNNSKNNTTNAHIVEIANPENVSKGYQKVWAGGDRVIALAGDDNLYTWGDNEKGILGINSDTSIIEKPTKLMFDIRPVE